MGCWSLASRRPGRAAVLLMTSVLMIVGLIGAGPSAGAVRNTCRARNVSQDRPSRSDLQGVIDAADPGDKIAVRNVCVGSFTISKDLTLVGKSSAEIVRPVLNANAVGRVLAISAQVRLTHLEITGGKVADDGGGVALTGILILDHSIVRENQANDRGGGIYVSEAGVLTLRGWNSVTENTSDHGGGIANFGTTILNGSSAVSGNQVRSYYHYRHGGGIYNGGVLEMNGTSSVSGNLGYYSPGSGIYNFGILTMNDSSTVSNNAGTYGSVAGGIANIGGTVTMNDSSSVRGNTSSLHSGGISNRRGTITMNDSSSVAGNVTNGNGGGIYNFRGTVTMNGASYVAGNYAGGSGGGIYNADVLYACTTWTGTLSPNSPDDPPTPTVITC